MKQNNKLSELPLEALLVKQQKLKGAVIGIAIVMLMTCITLIYLAVTTKSYGLSTISICCLITLLPSFMALSQLNTEIKSQKSI